MKVFDLHGAPALAGMDVRTSAWAGLAAFSRRLFHGLPLAQAVGPAALKELALASAREACRDAGVRPDGLEIMALAPGLAGSLSSGLDLPVTDLSGRPNPLADACLADGEKPLLLADIDPKTGLASAAVLFPPGKAAAAPAKKYALLTGLSAQFSDLDLTAPGLLEWPLAAGPGRLTNASSLFRAFTGQGEPSCALDQALPGLAGLVKAAWCLYERLLPAYPGRNEDGGAPDLEGTALFACPESRTWFPDPARRGRRALLAGAGRDGALSGLMLAEASHPDAADWSAPGEEDFRLFPLAAASEKELLEKIAGLKTEAESGVDLRSAARAAWLQFLKGDFLPLRACLLAHSPAELAAECGFALRGIPPAAERNGEWQTPLGSYFTAAPLGSEGRVSFIYPGGFNSYVGLGRDLFHHFPNLLERLSDFSRDAGSLINEKKLYPRAQKALSQADLERAELDLNRDPVALLISGSTLAVLYTLLLRETFGIQAGSAFGYSLGEISMMFASGAWSHAEEITAALRASPLFQSRMSGRQEAVREYFARFPGMDAAGGDEIWSNHVLMTDEHLLRQALEREPGVFLTHINTPRQFVIGGEPAACRRLVAELRTPSLQAPYNFALHCDAVRSEYDALAALHSWPVNPGVPFTLYSAYDGLPMPLEREAAARRIAAGLCSCVDFPHLVRQVYDAGGRIFIELGAGSNCARWIDETLKGQPHAAFSINRKGADDYSSILRLLARLTCHHVNLDLQPLYK